MCSAPPSRCKSGTARAAARQAWQGEPPTVLADLNIGEREYGWITAAFQLGIMLQPVAGYVLDLIGLPPTVREVDAFVKDQSPDAYERFVDRLLASPRYGERWGRHWMDVWRYSDWYGFGAEVRFTDRCQTREVACAWGRRGWNGSGAPGEEQDDRQDRRAHRSPRDSNRRPAV